MAIHLDQPAAAQEPGASLRQWWSVVAALLVTAIFVQAVLAGAMLSGFEWARLAHAANAVVVVAATVIAGLAAAVTLWRVPGGRKLGAFLQALAAAAVVQFAVGRMAAKGINVMWAHVPLGVALVGLAGQAVAAARKLGAP
jgi:hypothetical protein